MTDKEPTPDQIKEFWERRGFIYFQTNSGWVWVYPDGMTQNIKLPTVNLNNLFKYAVPKLGFCQLHKNPLVIDWQATVSINDEPAIIRRNPDPALALF